MVGGYVDHTQRRDLYSAARPSRRNGLIGGLDRQVGSVVRQSAKVSGSIPGGAKVLGTDGICKYLPVSVSSYVEVCLCLLCSVCIT